MIEYSSTSHDKDVPDNFIYLTEVIPKVRFDLRYYSDDNFIGQPIPGYHSNVMIVTLQAALALKKSAAGTGLCKFFVKTFRCLPPAVRR